MNDARTFAALCIALSVCGCGEHRAERPDPELSAANDAFVTRLAAERAAFVRKMARRMKIERDEYEGAIARGESAAAPVFDVLILSGGGDYGAFGAGFLQGWGTVTDNEFKRPQFDVVTGVSTGALIAPSRSSATPIRTSASKSCTASPRATG